MLLMCRIDIEADYIGMLLLGAASFHPNNALKYLWKQAKIDGASTVFDNFVSAYPSNEKRMDGVFIAIGSYGKGDDTI